MRQAPTGADPHHSWRFPPLEKIARNALANEVKVFAAQRRSREQPERVGAIRSPGYERGMATGRIGEPVAPRSLMQAPKKTNSKSFSPAISSSHAISRIGTPASASR